MDEGLIARLTAPADRAQRFAGYSRLDGVAEGKSDALRHGMWMGGTSRAVSETLGGGRIGKAIGPVAAQILGAIFEGATFPQAAWADGLVPAAQSSLMDINNNRVGAYIGAHAPDQVAMEQQMLDEARNANYAPSGFSAQPGMLFRKR
jgi:hypothetical protein